MKRTRVSERLRTGAVTKRGLEDLVRRRHGTFAAIVVLVAVLGVNFLTFAADLEGGKPALQLLSHVSYLCWIVPLAAASLAVLILGSYAKIERILLYIPFAFVTYVNAAFLAHPHWGDVLRGTFLPHIRRTQDYFAGAIALLGTTFTAYAYLWQQIEMTEEPPPIRRIGLLQLDATGGAVASGVTFWFIVVATGAILGVTHRHVQTAAETAFALAPVAGRFAPYLFGAGLLGSALLALPVLLTTSPWLRFMGRATSAVVVFVAIASLETTFDPHVLRS